MTITRHEFLALLHADLKPRRYLEIGVQYGTSLNLATSAESAIGIDPYPLCQPHGNQQIFTMTADDFFQYMATDDWIDFAFIDGSHLSEDALRDFMNIEKHSHDKTVVVFDDVLPYNSAIATRAINPGDWTGDIWKLYDILKRRTDLQVYLVDTFPTGTMVVWNLDQKDLVLPQYYMMALDYLESDKDVPDDIIKRTWAVQPEVVLNLLRER